MGVFKINKKAKIATILAITTMLLVLVLLVVAAPKKCNNGADDDNDGLVDYPNDPGCSSARDDTETGTAVCDNGADETNDRDTLADFRLSGGDPGCTSTSDTSETDGDCDDLDDESYDRDTLTDSTDPGCTSTSDTSETDGDCDDLDDETNDADSLADGSDPGCSSTTDTSEVDGACDDLTDNDSDGKTDYGITETNDSKCANFTDDAENPRDFCSDSDGGIVTGTAGTVSGDDEDLPFSFSDTCFNATLLTERYCGTKAQDFAPLATNLTCTGNFTTCSNGACA